MDRRDFFKILSATSGALGGCGKTTDKLIPLLVPEHEIVPGEEQWHPAVCAECGAGCATVVRIMESVRTIERNGEQLRERIAAIKKIEGNPLDPISGGRLCARGQASVQSLYHPDRSARPHEAHRPARPGAVRGGLLGRSHRSGCGKDRTSASRRSRPNRFPRRAGRRAHALLPSSASRRRWAPPPR